MDLITCMKWGPGVYWATFAVYRLGELILMVMPVMNEYETYSQLLEQWKRSYEVP